MRAIRIGVVLGLAGLVIFSAARQKDPNPLAPGVYLDQALSVMRSKAVIAPAVEWVTVTRRAHRMTADAKTPEDTYPAIQYALDQLRQAGDLHAMFLYPSEARAFAQASPPLQPPAVALVQGRLGKVTLPGLIGPSRSREARGYVTTVLSGIESLQKRYRPCGWIVDLRGDTGGNVYPMLLSIGPIIGEGHVAGFTGRSGFAYWVTYRRGTLSGGGYTARAPLMVPPLASTPPVAVLTSQLTASAGEFVTVAFRGRTQTRSFGAATGGYTTGPRVFRLANGAELFFGISYYVDRLGVIYRHPVQPDMTVYLDEAAATRWLLSTHACTQTSRTN
jgi:C-terminal processing protease CtpA/Prc